MCKKIINAIYIWMMSMCDGILYSIGDDDDLSYKKKDIKNNEYIININNDLKKNHQTIINIDNQIDKKKDDEWNIID
jgi:hypothetical protein